MVVQLYTVKNPSVSGRHPSYTGITCPPWLEREGSMTQYSGQGGPQSSRAFARVSTAPTLRGGQTQQHNIHSHKRASLWDRPSENDAVIGGKVGLYWTIKQ